MTGIGRKKTIMVHTFDEKKCLVTRPMGSWRWQNAYAIADYVLQCAARGSRLVWKFNGRTPKRSLPQMRRCPWLKWDIRSVPDPVQHTIESHPASPYNQDL